MKRLVILVLLFGLAACSMFKHLPLSFQTEPPSQWYTQGEKALKNKNYQRAVHYFEQINVQNPLDPNIKQSQLYLIYAYYMQSEYALAIAQANYFIQNYPANTHADYAYYLRGVAHYHQGLGLFERFLTIDLAQRDLVHFQEAYQDFATLYALFHPSIYREAAHQQMIYLRNLFAQHELEVAQYYYQHFAYIAAANRASRVVSHYQRTPAVPEALRIMAQSYHALKLYHLEKRTLEIMHYNHL